MRCFLGTQFFFLKRYLVFSILLFFSISLHCYLRLSNLFFLFASLVAQRLKHLPLMRETWVRSLGQEDPLEKEMATHSSSCLENPMDGGAWWATGHGVTKSRTRLSDLTFNFNFLFSETLHAVEYIFPFLLCLLFLFSAICKEQNSPWLSSPWLPETFPLKYPVYCP